MSAEFALEWHLDPSWSGAGRDWSQTPELALHYQAFRGNLVLRGRGVSLDAMWGWIPLLDLAVGFDRAGNELAWRGPGHIARVEFTENDEELRFERRVNSAVISASYAEGEIEVPLPVLLQRLRGFLDGLCGSLGDEHPSLRGNRWFTSLRYRPDLESVAFAGELVAGIGGAEEVLRSHVEDNDEVLPHVFLGDLMPWLIDELERPGGPARVGEIVDRLERGFAHGPESVDNLVAVSFLEVLPRPGERGAELRGMLGSACAAHVDEWRL